MARVSATRALSGFVAGFLAVPFCHQLVLAVLYAAGIAPFAPFNLEPVAPFGMPSFLSASFWGGAWGVVFAMVEGRFPPGRYWLAAFGFGAILPTAVALFVVVPLKGGPIGAGFLPAVWLTAILVNGAWGLGTGLGLRMLGDGGSAAGSVHRPH